MSRLAVTFAATVLAATASAQFTVTVPNGTATTEGNSSTAYPWGRGTAQIRVQYVYDSTHFTAQGITTPIVINQLRFRANTLVTTAGYTYSNATVQLSSAAVDYLTPSTTFASNHGPNVATVYTGPVTVATPAGTTPNSWYVTLPVSPFLYDPTSGSDLCIDMQHDGVGAPSTAGPAHDCVTTGALTSRIYNLTNALSPTGTIQQAVGITIEVGYAPPAGLFANFSANVTGGASPLNVQFTDSSFSSAPAGVTSWAWDFNGDNVVDSNLQNPSFTYTSCGSYTVSLTVNDGVNPPSTFTRPNYVVTDLITADFTSQLIGPLTLQFADTSSIPATSWAWDFNGDAVVDSTLQNPTWVFPNTNPTNVSLTVTRLCSPPSQITKSVIAAQVLTTNLVANNSVGTPATLYFNLDVLNAKGVNISAFDSISTTLNTAFTVDVYLKTGTYVGSELVATPWSLVATASGTSNPVSGQPSLATFPLPLHIPQGSYGVALRYVGITPRYVTGTVLTTYGNGDLSLTLGAASLSTAGAFTGTNLNSPRIWSGTLYYGTNNITGLAGYGFFGQGCPGTLGHVSVTNSTHPVIGGTLQTTVNNLQFDLAVMILGLSNTTWNAIPLPLDLAILGAPGCPLRVSVDASETVVGAGGTASWNFNIPNNPALNGFQLYSQAASLDNSNAFGFVTSRAYGWVVGN